MNKLIAVLGTLLLIGTSLHYLNLPTDDPKVALEFTSWKARYGKVYNDAESELYRLQVYAENKKKIEKVNKANLSYTFAVNQFMDLTPQEFAATYLTLIPETNSKFLTQNYQVTQTNESVDWRKKGAVTPVVDQGQCGSCWAFSATGNLEGVSHIFGGKDLVPLSEQELVDCDTKSSGCGGGWMDNAFEFTQKNGIATAADYPYSAVQGKCQKFTPYYTNKGGYYDVKKGDVQELKNAVKQQPTSVAVDAMNWQFYSGGIFSDCGTSLDHGVLAVGYQDDDQGFWIVKNSWSASWGEQGYIRIKMGNTCGIANAASSSKN